MPTTTKRKGKSAAAEPTKLRPLNEVASEIWMTLSTEYGSREQDFVKRLFAAVPYLEAMKQLKSLDDSYGADDARSIVLYFLGNVSAWHGENARRLKAELNNMLRNHDPRG